MARIVLSKAARQAIEHLQKRNRTAQVAFEQAGRNMEAESNELWDAIRKMFPQVPERARLNTPKKGNWSIDFFDAAHDLPRSVKVQKDKEQPKCK